MRRHLTLTSTCASSTARLPRAPQRTRGPRPDPRHHHSGFGSPGRGRACRSNLTAPRPTPTVGRRDLATLPKRGPPAPCIFTGAMRPLHMVDMARHPGRVAPSNPLHIDAASMPADVGDGSVSSAPMTPRARHLCAPAAMRCLIHQERSPPRMTPPRARCAWRFRPTTSYAPHVGAAASPALEIIIDEV